MDREGRRNFSEAKGCLQGAEVDHHNDTHIPCSVWCPACMSGRARDRPGRRAEEKKEDKRTAE